MFIVNKRKRTWGICLALACCVGVLGGCSLQNRNGQISEKTEGTEDEIVSLGLTPEFNYEVPDSLPAILVDQVGYAAPSNKIAVFRGEILPDTYQIINVDTKEIVYSGEIENKGFDSVTNEAISYGDFTEFTDEGTYYLQAEYVGQSYSFVIKADPYAEIFDQALKQYYYNRCGANLSVELAGKAAHNACHTRMAQLKADASMQLDVSGGWHVDESGTRDVVEGCQAIDALMLAYELYGDVFSDDIGIPESGNGIPDVMDEICYEVDWLLKMQDTTSGAVYSGVSVINNGTSSYLLYAEDVTMEATVQFAAAIAKFSYLYQNYDRDFATRCLQAADRAYRYAGKYLDDVSPEAYFFAAAELYRASGNRKYRNVVNNYLVATANPDMNDDSMFYGSVTYMSTKQRVDVEQCDKLIDILLSDVEEISYASKNSRYLTEGNGQQSNNDELLKKMARLVVVDHIITNHEYAMVLENHLHYFLGRNAYAVSYIENAGGRSYRILDEKAGIMKQVDLNAELILLMSAIEEELSPVSHF